jgi:hypothetical protein
MVEILWTSGACRKPNNYARGFARASLPIGDRRSPTRSTIDWARSPRGAERPDGARPASAVSNEIRTIRERHMPIPRQRPEFPLRELEPPSFLPRIEDDARRLP